MTQPTRQKAERSIIVLARFEMTGRQKTGRLVPNFDGYLVPEYVAAPEPHACVWLNDGTCEDVEAARKYAETEGFKVYSLPINEPDPIAKAKSLLTL